MESHCDDTAALLRGLLDTDDPTHVTDDHGDRMSLPTRNPRLLSLAHLKDLIGNGEIDTVVIAFTDMQGRLQGKRLHAAYFLDVVLEQGAEGCNYLLGVDVDMNTVDGYAMTSWEKGYGDMEFVLDYDTIRLLPHLPDDRDGPVRPGARRPRAGRAVAAHDPEEAARPRRRRSGTSRWPAPSSSSSCSTTPTRAPGTPATATSRRATSTTSTTPSWVRRAWSRCCATSATRCTPPA